MIVEKHIFLLGSCTRRDIATGKTVLTEWSDELVGEDRAKKDVSNVVDKRIRENSLIVKDGPTKFGNSFDISDVADTVKNKASHEGFEELRKVLEKGKEEDLTQVDSDLFKVSLGAKTEEFLELMEEVKTLPQFFCMSFIEKNYIETFLFHVMED